jgi:hypothetical protein
VAGPGAAAWPADTSARHGFEHHWRRVSSQRPQMDRFMAPPRGEHGISHLDGRQRLVDDPRHRHDAGPSHVAFELQGFMNERRFGRGSRAGRG